MKRINPFSVVKANEFSYEQILKYWVDYGEIEEGGFISSLNPKELMPKYVLGSKGCGKTHILKYYSFDARLLFYDNDISELLKKDGYIASYWRLDVLSSTRFNKDSKDITGWKELFGYYFEIHQVIIALRLYQRITEALKTPRSIIEDIIAGITGQVGINLKTQTIDEFVSFLTEKRVAIDKEIIDSAFTKKIRWDVVKPLFPFGSLIFEVPNAFSENVKELKNVNYVFVLDELEKLRVDWQKEALNTLVFEKKNNCTFWVGARKNGYTTRNTLSGEPLHDGHEFVTVDLDRILRRDEKAFKKFAVNLFKRRLEISELPVIEPDTLFESFNDKTLLETLAQKELSHWKKLRNRFKSIGLTAQQSDRLINALQHQVQDKPLEQKLKLYLFYIEWAKHKNDITVEILYDAAKEVNKQYDTYMNIGDSRIKEIYKKFRQDFISQLAEENNEDLFQYTGFKNLVQISDCNPRVYLTLLKQIVEDSYFRGNQLFELGKTISLRSQYVGSNVTAKWFLNDIEVYGRDKEDLDIAMNSLLNYFYVSRYCDKPTETSLCAFYFRKEAGQEKINEILRLAVNESFLIEIDNGRKDKTLAVPQQTFQINSLVATLYNLSTARRGVNSIRPKMLKAIFDSGHFQEFNSVLASYRSSLNAPFIQKTVKVKETPKDNWPTLFDEV